MPKKFTSDSDRSRWDLDGLGAVLLDDNGSWQARLEVRNWYEDQSRDPVVAWVVEWPVPDGRAPYMYETAIEHPALLADNDERRTELIARARAALLAPRTTVPDPFETPSKALNADAWSALLDRQIWCWVDSFNGLCTALNATEDSATYPRYRHAVEALGWAYAVDSSLNLLWNRLSPTARELESLQTDANAAAAIIHNSRSVPTFDANNDGPFAGYLQRQRERRPYKRWSDVMLAGLFQSRFFIAISWVRGQLVHAGADLPMELQQYKPGIQPNWKFSDSASFGRGRQSQADQKVYDQVLAGWDVVGGLGHLVDVFADAERRLTQRLRAEESSPTE